MKSKRLIAALAAVGVLAPSAAFAATVVSSVTASTRLAPAASPPSVPPAQAARRHRADAREATRERLRAQRLRAQRTERRQLAAAFGRVPRGTLDAIAACESHGDPGAIGGGGAYRGMFQMTYDIWAAVGGSGDPAAAPAAEQYYRAALVYARYGAGQWPVCGR